MTEERHIPPTRYIKKWADSAKFQLHSSHLSFVAGTGTRSEMPNFSYTETVKLVA